MRIRCFYVKYKEETMVLNSKVLLSWVVVIAVNYFVHYNGKQFYDNRIAQGKTFPKIFDIGFQTIPDLSQDSLVTYVADYAFYLPVLILLFNKDWEALRMSVGLSLTIQLFRLLFISSTILPRIKKCDDTSYGIYNLLHGNCYDKMFSGHMAALTVNTLLTIEKGYVSPLVGASFIGGTAMVTVATRNHYTIDVLVGIFVAYAVKNMNLSMF